VALSKKNSGWLRLLMEDIMRLSREKSSPLMVEDVTADCGVEKEEVMDAVYQLERKGLVRFEKKRLFLAEQGEKVADVKYNYHRIVEEILGHNVAHALEHLGDTAEKVKKLRKM